MISMFPGGPQVLQPEAARILCPAGRSPGWIQATEENLKAAMLDRGVKLARSAQACKNFASKLY